MTEIEKIITSNTADHLVRTEIVPLLTVPVRADAQEKPHNTFKNATREEIDTFVQHQTNLDEEEKMRLSERLMTIQQKLKEKSTPDQGSGL